MASLATLSAVASKFDNLSEERRQSILDLVGGLIDFASFGSQTALAWAYYAAHLLEIDERTRKGIMGSGRVTSQSKLADGSGVVGFAPQLLNRQSSDEALRSTQFGLEYLNLRDSLADCAGPRVIR